MVSFDKTTDKTTGGFLAFGQRDFIPKRTTRKTSGGSAKKSASNTNVTGATKSKKKNANSNKSPQIRDIQSVLTNGQTVVSPLPFSAASSTVNGPIPTVPPVPPADRLSPNSLTQGRIVIPVRATQPGTDNSSTGNIVKRSSVPPVVSQAPVNIKPSNSLDRLAMLRKTEALRQKLHDIKRARVAAAQSGQNVSDFIQAEREIKTVLADLNRARNAVRAASITPEQAIANAQSLDDQTLDAQASVLQGAMNRLQKANEFAAKFPGAFPQSRVDAAKEALDESSLRFGTVSPTFFRDRARQRPSQNDLDDRANIATEQLLQTLRRGTPTADEFASRGFRTQEDFARSQRDLAEIEAQKRLADRVAGGQIGDDALAQFAGLNPGTPLTDDLRQAIKNAMTSQLSAQTDQIQNNKVLSDIQNRSLLSQAIANTDPNIKPILEEFPSVMSEVLDDRGVLDLTINDSARKRLDQLLGEIESLPPDKREIASNAIRQRLLDMNFDFTRLEREVFTPFRFVGRPDNLTLPTIRKRLSNIINNRTSQ